MKVSILASLLFLTWCTAPLCAETVPASPAQSAPEPEIVVRKAIPVDEPVTLDVDALPRTRPADVKIIYNHCIVENNAIAITFDDGPDPVHTPRLLDALKARGMKATFFLVGKCAAAWPDIVKRMADEGHEIGNHMWNHHQFTRLGESKVIHELQMTHDAIVKACGVTPILYRPPYGATRLSQQKLIHDHFDYTAVLWDVDPLDWKTPRSAAKVRDRVVSHTKAGSIILCHDIHRETVDAMPATLDDLKARGFQFVTVTQLLNLESQTLAKRAAIVAAAKVQAQTEAAAAAASAPLSSNPSAGAEPAGAPAPTSAAEPKAVITPLPSGTSSQPEAGTPK